MSLLQLVLIVGATARLTRLIQSDSILDPVRDPVLKRARRSGAKAWELLWCPWCLSCWVGAVVVASWWAWGDVKAWFATGAVLTASQATGLSDLFEER